MTPHHLAKTGLQLRFGWSWQSDLWVNYSPITKVLDSPVLFHHARHKTVYRHVWPEPGTGQYRNRTPTQAFSEIVAELNGYHPTFLEPTNETGDTDLAYFIPWLAEFTAIANAHRYNVAGFSFAPYQPGNLGLWSSIAENNFCGVQALAQHCYWRTPWPLDDPWALRHEAVSQALALRGYHHHPPWLITECGDSVGWGYHLSAGDAASQIAVYDAHLAADPTVEGAMVFIHGGCPDYCGFETDPIAEALAAQYGWV